MDREDFRKSVRQFSFDTLWSRPKSGDGRGDDRLAHEGFGWPQTIPAMVRDLDGRIWSWSTAAERRYGWSRREAVGNVSHHLLQTIFPCPLQEINRELLTRGYWEGELIHTLSTGYRVKVFSRWELKKDDKGADLKVVEVNRGFTTVEPDTAFLTKRRAGAWLLDKMDSLYQNRWYFFAPVAFLLIAAAVLGLFAEEGVFRLGLN